MASPISGVWQSSKYSQPESVYVEDVREHICLCVHGDLFPIGAKYIDSFKTSTTVALQRKSLLQLFCAVLVDMYTVQAERLQNPAPKESRKHDRKGNPIEDSRYEAALTDWEDVQRNYDPNNIRAYVETVKAAGRHVCFRLHILTSGDSENHITESLRNVLRSNEEELDKRLKGNPKFARPLETWQSLFIGVEPYARSCDMYTRSNTCSDNMSKVVHLLNHIGTSDNPANPLDVFSLSRAIAIEPHVGVHPDQLDVDAYFRDGAPNGRIPRPFEFPEVAMEHLVRLLPSQFSPRGLFRMMIPYYQFVDEERIQKYFEDGIARGMFGVGMDGSEYDPRALMQDYSIPIRRKLLAPTYQLRSEASTFTRESLLMEFYGRIWDADAPISNAGKAIYVWWEASEHFPVVHEPFDSELTVFGHFVQRLYMQINHHGLVSTAHDSIFQMLIGCLDAYRCSPDLHLNGIATGNSSTGKSFMLDLVKSWSIPGTISETTRKTAASDAVEPENPGAFSDRILFFHELPGSMVKEGYRENDQEAELKSALTSGIVTTEHFHQDDDGTRRKRRIENDVTGTIWAANNDGMKGMSESMVSRWLHLPMDIVFNKKRDVASCKFAERTRGAEHRAADARFAYECRWRQGLVWMVEKMICAGDGVLLPSVEMFAAQEVFGRLEKGVKKERGGGGPRVHMRDMERCRIYARLFTILSAIERTFCVPGAKHRGVSPVTPTHLLDIAPFLVCTEEIAVFTFTMLRNQFFDRNASKILTYVEEIWEENGRHYKAKPQPPRSIFGGQVAVELDYNYARLPFKRRDLATQIHVKMTAAKGKVSIPDIELALMNLCTHTMTTREWESEDRPGDERRLTKAQCDPNKAYYHILRNLFGDNSEAGASERVLLQATHAFTEPQRVITAFHPEDGEPHELRAVPWEPRGGEGSNIELQNFNHVIEKERLALGYRTAGTRVTRIEESFEALAFRKAGVARF